jgi:uncharacterized membrane protein
LKLKEKYAFNETMNKDSRDPEHNKVIRVYAALTGGLLLSLVPQVLFAALSALFLTGAMITAYGIRRRASRDGLAANHMTYIIRTLWISSGLAVLTMSVATAYILSVYDPTPIHNCVDRLMGSGGLDYAAASALIQPCMGEFLSANYPAFYIGGMIMIGPVAFYFVYRLTHGLSRALKGYRIANIKSWL